MARLFLSHNWQDKPFVRFLASKLSEAGHHVWLDEAEIAIGDSLIQKISEGLQTSDYVVAVISKTSVQSNWVRKELELAMHREISGMRVHVLPILVHRCDIPYFLRDKLYADFTDESQFESSLRQLMGGIEKHDVGYKPARDMVTNAQTDSTCGQTCKRGNSMEMTSVGSSVTMKDVEDLRLTKGMRGAWRFALFYGTLGTIGLIAFLLTKWLDLLDEPLGPVVGAVILASYAAATCAFFEGITAYIILQDDKRFAFDVERLEGSLLPLGRNWRSLLSESWHHPIRLLYLLFGALWLVLPLVVFLVEYLDLR